MRPYYVLAVLACSLWASDSDIPKGQLLDDVAPVSYELLLNLDPEKSTFNGTVHIQLDLKRKSKEFWMHGNGLRVKKATLNEEPVSYEQVSQEGVVQIKSEHKIPSGKAELVIEYEADFSNDLMGLYVVKQDKESYVYSQLEPISARSVFPCFDEPRFKTPYRIKMKIPISMTGISNTLVADQHKNIDKQTKVLIFEDTKPLPTYLLAFAVGHFDVVNADKIDKRIPFRGIAPKGLGPKMLYAMKETPKLLEILEGYFGIPYPFSKLDIIAVPDFAAGAMENAGAITFRDSLLLFDAKTAPIWQSRRFAEVMAHELSHQWFGNLVTLSWWNDLWLNEAFATWMATKAIMQYNPDYHADWYALQDMQKVMEEDSLESARRIAEPVKSQDDIYNAFDGITYQKGAAVLDMFEHYIGPKTFQKGVQKYLKKFAYQNTESKDFISGLSDVAKENLKPAFDTFLNQAGVPYLEFEPGRYTQSRYVFLGSKIDPLDHKWQIPFCPTEEKCHLLSNVKGHAGEFRFPAKDGRGYYRFMGAKNFKLSGLNDLEKMAYIDNLKADFVAGKLKVEDILPSLAEIAKSNNRFLATSPISIVTWLNDYVPSANLTNYARKLYSSKPQIKEAEEQKLFDVDYLNFESFVVRNKKIRQDMLNQALKYLKNQNSVDSNRLGVILKVLIQEKPAYFDKLQQMLIHNNDAVQRARILAALAESDRSLPMLLSHDLRKNEISLLLYMYMSQPKRANKGLAWVQKNQDALLKALPGKMATRLPGVFHAFCSTKKSDAVKALLGPVIDQIPGGKRELEGVLEKIRLCEALVLAQNQPEKP